MAVLLSTNRPRYDAAPTNQAVELTASQNLSQKRSGYLTAALTLSPTHEFRFMLVNQMQRDLSSSNMLEAAAALTALCKLGECVPHPLLRW